MAPDDYELAQYLAWQYNHRKLYEKSYPLFVKAARGGMVSAMCQLGWMCKAGVGTKKDPDASLSWYRMAEANGNAWGTCGIASAYEHGVGVPVDLRKSFAIYQELADRKGDNPAVGMACYETGRFLETGLGRPADLQAAVKYYTRAARIPRTFGADERARRRLEALKGKVR